MELMVERKFKIAESNDVLYNIFLVSTYLLSACLILVILILHLHENSPALLIVLLVTFVLVPILRFLFKNHIIRGEIEIRKKEIYVNNCGQESVIREIERIEFHCKGYFAAPDNKLIPSEDGTGNILTIHSRENESISHNLFLANSTNKRDILYVLERFCASNKIKLTGKLY